MAEPTAEQNQLEKGGKDQVDQRNQMDMPKWRSRGDTDKNPSGENQGGL